MTDNSTQSLPLTEATALCEAIIDEISSAVVVSEDVLMDLLTGLLVRQHILIEDVPGTGKTLTAQSLAKTLGVEFNRIQFTPDLLPSDITGSVIFDDSTDSFRFTPGPIFANVVLADEINRAPAKTQAALLEAMGENQVTVGNETRALPDPFFVIATQNPVEQAGTFALPESQRDRFIIKTSLGYPDYDDEQQLLNRRLDRENSVPEVTQTVDPDRLKRLLTVPEKIYVAPEIRDYILTLSRKTREHGDTAVGVSPRGVQRFLEATRARAVISGREYVIPADIKALAVPVLAHRLVVQSTAAIAETEKSEIITDIIDETPVPAMEGDASA
jgi:MoxR-like ATPase